MGCSYLTGSLGFDQARREADQLCSNLCLTSSAVVSATMACTEIGLRAHRANG